MSSFGLVAWLNSPLLTYGSLAIALTMFVGGLIIFTIQSLVVGRITSPRGREVGGSIVLSSFLLEFGLWLFRPTIALATRLRIHPDVFSWATLVISALAGLVFARGAMGVAGLLLAFGAFCDTLDGGVARARNMTSASGAVLDAVVDRWGEMFVFFGLAWYYRNDALGFTCALGACFGAVTVSYARAKGESMGVVARMGLMQRHERAFWIIMPTITSAVYYAWHALRSGTSVVHPRYEFIIVGLGLIAALGSWTGIQRMNYIRRSLSSR